ncbi:MAG: Gfo/Idh/MocA family oxidoreductase [Dysgonamonadaceae bacterium]|nr:Gfo/Idh/MocA family oxidoreductase [Dysgonamonadaceae bacterium]MDD4729602.1 Gfo/Idh/MocA family oxidoreductase [Dysgonamonadaceae bacterium]
MSKQLTRRDFIKSAAIGATGVVMFPQFLASCKQNKGDDNGSNDGIIRLGFIGLGRQAMYLLNGYLDFPDVRVVAGSDVYGIKRDRFVKRVNTYYAQDDKQVEVETYENYKDLLARKDIDAVIIASPDHWHAFMAIDACKAKKNIYLEKPLTFTIKEGQLLNKAVRDNGVILAVGSQQRSDINFQHAVKMVQEGKIGKIERVNAYVGAPPTPYDLPEETVPADLNWPLWLGPSEFVHYNSQLNPPISLDPEQNEQFWGAWRWYKELGGGFTTDWGAHMFDIAQWALGMDESGPIEIIPAGFEETKYLTFIYANGTVVTEEPFNEQKTKGVKFWGDKGWIEVSRGHFLASDDSLLPPKTEELEGVYETKIPHLENFVNALKTKTEPVVPVEIGHRSCTVCTLGNIAYDLGRPIKWNPKTEAFVDDPEATANRLYNKTYSEGYTL